MKKTYTKPMLFENENLVFEGIYATGSTSVTVGCQSQYTGGVYHATSDYQPQNGGFLKAYGCQGCPADWNNGSCHVASYTAYMTTPFMPSWELQGHAGSDTHW